eukprot:CAMPEP_0202726314 /NCGR_PEP_ID=MMETSP1385-20130828/184549_1 /ASSEMBLY_ACC=CAM_ASM_000861 /TAXON_ID=933848 /ORGANISM="Elphidium margaritaceum" /LENGTH=356 /DNA_ID=CAMNT_0049392533 /DNA_START=92 /DNA_END=1162 /DNA_ORIENTATION=+
MSVKEMEKGANGLRSPSYYLKCMFGGVLACGFTHASVVTLDVAKCRAQAHSKAGRWPSGLVPGIRKIVAEEGVRGMRVGWVPTFYGYGLQGLFKFGLNEFFKDTYSHMLGEEWILESKARKMALWAAASGSAEIFADIALCPFEMTKVKIEWILESKARKMALWAAASGSAEIFADIALCPFEMTKVKMQVTLAGQEGSIPHKLLPGMSAMMARRADTRFPFGSLVPLWGRQVPYTMIKFVGFYMTAEAVYEQIEKRYGYKKSDLSDTTQLGITFACGYWAGIFCAIATQPMDNLVSMKGIPENKTKPWGQMASEMGTYNLFTKGLGTRIIMIGTLTGLQWWIYGTTKYYMGFGTQ